VTVGTTESALSSGRLRHNVPPLRADKLAATAQASTCTMSTVTQSVHGAAVVAETIAATVAATAVLILCCKTACCSVHHVHCDHHFVVGASRFAELREQRPVTVRECPKNVLFCNGEGSGKVIGIRIRDRITTKN